MHGIAHVLGIVHEYVEGENVHDDRSKQEQSGLRSAGIITSKRR